MKLVKKSDNEKKCDYSSAFNKCNPLVDKAWKTLQSCSNALVAVRNNCSGLDLAEAEDLIEGIKDVIDDAEAIASMGYDVIKRLEKEG